MTQIIFDPRSDLDKLIDDQQARLIMLNRKMRAVRLETWKWAAASAACIAMPLYMVSQVEMSKGLAFFNTACAGLGLAAASKSSSTCRRFQEIDRVIWKEQGNLDWLNQRNEEATRGAFEINLDQKLKRLKGPDPSEQQGPPPQQGAGMNILPEWYEEKKQLELIFKGQGYPVTITDKQLVGRKIEFTIRPTFGTEWTERRGEQCEEDALIQASSRFASPLLYRLGWENARIVGKRGRLILEVDNPHAPPLLPISSRQSKQAEYVPQQQQQTEYQYQAQQHQPQSPSFVISQPSAPAAGNINIPTCIESAQPSTEDALFADYLKSPHNMICGKTNSGKTFLLSRLLIEWVAANPGGTVYILDRNFGKPDRKTGEIFDWNGIDERCIYKDDDRILSVLQTIQREMENLIQEFADFAMERSRCAREGKPFNRSQPQVKKVLTIVTEQNELADIFSGGKDAKSSAVLDPIGSILRQGNAYGYKIILDGQSISVTQSGITEALRQNLSICMVGENCVTSKEVRQFGSNTSLLVSQCSQLRSQDKRACIIQMGKGEPVATVVPEMGWIRDYRFGGVKPTVGETPEINDFDDRFEEKHGFDPDDVIEKDDNDDPWEEKPVDPNQSGANAIAELIEAIAKKLPEDPTDEQILAAFERVAGGAKAPRTPTERANLARYIRDGLNKRGQV